MHQQVHTSEHPIAASPVKRDLRNVRSLEQTRRPGCRPTEFWSLRHVLEMIGDEEPTGLGAATEVPHRMAS